MRGPDIEHILSLAKQLEVDPYCNGLIQEYVIPFCNAATVLRMESDVADQKMFSFDSELDAFDGVE